MKKLLLIIMLFVSLGSIAQQQTVTYSINPATFEETTTITITINGNSINEATWGVSGNALYLWAWAFDIDDTTQKGTPLNGTWRHRMKPVNSIIIPQMTLIQRHSCQQLIITRLILEN